MQANDTFRISRTFNAPRSLLWKVYTEREHLMQWFGPKGFTMPKADLDFRKGGTFLYCLRTPDGQDMWGKWVFRDIVEPEKLEVITSFSDPQGGITRHPMSPDWPRETLGITTFEETNGKTTVTVNWEVFNGTELERKVFADNQPGMQMGWTGTFEQLEAYLAKVGAG